MTATSFRTSVDLPPLVLPGSPHYDTARRAWNLHVDLRPAAVCVATRVELQSEIGYARAHGLRVAAQTTGHRRPARAASAAGAGAIAPNIPAF